jgi:hypothetical protein
MNLIQKIIQIYPSLTIQDFIVPNGTIVVQNNSDGKGEFIAYWNNSNPQPTQEQLDAIS